MRRALDAFLLSCISRVSSISIASAFRSCAKRSTSRSSACENLLLRLFRCVIQLSSWTVVQSGTWLDVCFGSKADICTAPAHVRFTPKSRHVQRTSACLLRAKADNDLLECQISVAELLWPGIAYQTAVLVIFRPPCAAQWSSRNRIGFRQDGGSQGLHLQRRPARLPCLLLSGIRP